MPVISDETRDQLVELLQTISNAGDPVSGAEVRGFKVAAVNILPHLKATIPAPEPALTDKQVMDYLSPAVGSWASVSYLVGPTKRRRSRSGWVSNVELRAIFVTDNAGREHVIDIPAIEEAIVNPGGNGQGIYLLVRNGEVVDRYQRAGTDK